MMTALKRGMGQILWFSGACLAAPGYLILSAGNLLLRKTEKK